MREAVLEVVEGGYRVERYQEDLVTCPACERRALASGGYAVSWEADWDLDDFREPWLVGAYPTVRLFPSSLACRVCGLELRGKDELRAASIPESWEIRDVDPEDFYEEYRQDERHWEPDYE